MQKTALTATTFHIQYRQWLNIIFATFQKYPRFLLQLNLKALGKIDKNDD